LVEFIVSEVGLEQLECDEFIDVTIGVSIVFIVEELLLTRLAFIIELQVGFEEPTIM
jgi:hypothetical protein